MLVCLSSDRQTNARQRAQSWSDNDVISKCLSCSCWGKWVIFSVCRGVFTFTLNGKKIIETKINRTTIKAIDFGHRIVSQVSEVPPLPAAVTHNLFRVHKPNAHGSVLPHPHSSALCLLSNIGIYCLRLLWDPWWSGFCGYRNNLETLKCSALTKSAESGLPSGWNTYHNIQV